jgi:hypothetical protein
MGVSFAGDCVVTAHLRGASTHSVGNRKCLPRDEQMIYDFEYDAQGFDEEREEAHP